MLFELSFIASVPIALLFWFIIWPHLRLEGAYGLSLIDYTHHGTPFIFLFVDFCANMIPIETSHLVICLFYGFAYTVLHTVLTIHYGEPIYFFLDFRKWFGWVSYLILNVQIILIFFLFKAL